MALLAAVDSPVVVLSLPALACLVGLVWVGGRFSRCGRGGVPAMLGLALIAAAFSTRAVGSYGNGAIFTTAFRAGGQNAWYWVFAVYDGVQLIGTGLGGLLLVVGVMAGRSGGANRE